MKKISLLGLLLIGVIVTLVMLPSDKQSLLFGQSKMINKGRVKPGIEVLKENDFKLLEGKRVGLITNPTGFDSELKSTVDLLAEAPNVELVALFGPEHGVRGNLYAGEKMESGVDSKSGIPLHSLYGATRKPTAEMLEGIDILLYDIQDIGSRSFTYISTMGLAMEAAAEAGIEFMVLDRPNPLGGNKVEGAIVEDSFISFVSQFPIPYIYGLTVGELALFLNEEGVMGKKCKLHVVEMEGWSRSMLFEETGLQWVPSSPHIPHPHTAKFYPTSGVMGELGFLSIGVGYTIPFQMFGAEWIDGEQLAERLNSYSLPGVHFRPLYVKPFYGHSKGINIEGVQIHITDYEAAQLTLIQFYVAQALAELDGDKALFDHANRERYSMFDKVCGSDKVRKLFSQRHKVEDILDYWSTGVEQFKEVKQKYHLY